MFVSDANAPTPLYDVPIDPEPKIGVDNWWNNKENAELVANSLLLEQDESLFDSLGSLKLPDKIGRAFYKAKTGKDWKDSNNYDRLFPDYMELMKSNSGYHYDDDHAKPIKDKLTELGIEVPNNADAASINAVF
jgi:hypothetical protein